MSEEIQCPHCHNPIYDPDALLCHFCGESLRRPSQGALGKMRYGWGRWVWAAMIIIVTAAMILIYM